MPIEFVAKIVISSPRLRAYGLPVLQSQQSTYLALGYRSVVGTPRGIFSRSSGCPPTYAIEAPRISKSSSIKLATDGGVLRVRRPAISILAQTSRDNSVVLT